MQRGLVIMLMHSNQPIWAWAETSAQPIVDGLDPARPRRGWAKPNPVFLGILLFPILFLRLFLLVSKYFFYVVKNTNPVLKYLVFVNLKKIEINVFMHTSKCLKAKKSYCVFHTPKKQCYSMHFGFNNQFIKVKRTLTKI
jgi:hypothetical protein